MTDPTHFNNEAETMPNGELRVRLTSPDGNNYIRTEAGRTGAWQKAHHHRTLRETYVVEVGWMGYVTEREGKLRVSIHWPHDVVTTNPLEPHNVYLPANAVIHTVKHGSDGAKDWNENPTLTARCAPLAEKDLHRLAAPPATPDSETRFDAYVDLYNNLDRLLWGIPSLLAVAATVLIGFSGNLLNRQAQVDVPPIVLALVFALVGTLFALGAYSIWRLRVHHTLAGSYLAKMETDGYFVVRAKNVASAWPPSAPALFLLAYTILASLSFAVALIAIVHYEWLLLLTKWKPTS
jgi:hypothetical protein